MRYFKSAVRAIARGFLAVQLVLFTAPGALAHCDSDADLTATQACTTAAHHDGFTSVVIQEGGTTRTVTASDPLTPAEHIAVHQVLSGGVQSLILGTGGAAVGGTFDISRDALNMTITNAVIPNGVTALYNATTLASLNLLGNLTNYGTFYAYTSSAATLSASINAVNIYNQPGAVLSSIFPTSGIGGIVSATSSLNFNLNALQDIMNAGVISSSGALSLTAGGTIGNTLPAGITGPTPVIMAMNSLNLQAAGIVNSGLMQAQLGSLNAYTASLVNSSVMQSLGANVNISNVSGNTLVINNSLGLISAHDTILLETLGSTLDAGGNLVSRALLTVSGGVFDAPQLVLKSPQGTVSLYSDRITGGVTLTAGTAAVGVNQGDLRLASMQLSEDPLFYNVLGNLDLSGLFSSGSTFFTAGQDFVALSGGSIIAPGAPADALIDATNPLGAGGKITLAAGVSFTTSGGASPVACSLCDPNFTITGASGLGGSIVLPTVALTTNNNSINLIALSGEESRSSITIGDLHICDSGLMQERAPSINLFSGGDINFNNVSNLVGGLNAFSTSGDIIMAPGKSIATFNGSISLGALSGSILLSQDTLNSVGGNLFLFAGNRISLGLDGSYGAWRADVDGFPSGGSISLIAGKDIVSAGGNSLTANGGDINISSLCGNVFTGEEDKLHACGVFEQADQGEDPIIGGNISLFALNGDVTLASATALDAVGGNIFVSSAVAGGGNIVTGDNVSLNAFRLTANHESDGGSVTLVSPHGGVSLGNDNAINAVGGNVQISAGGNLTTGSSSTVNAFANQVNGGSVGGDISLASTAGDISLSADNSFNAAGGDLKLTAKSGGISTGSAVELNAFNSISGNISTGGAVNLCAGGEVALGDDNKLAAVGGDLTISSSASNVTTGAGDSLKSCGIIIESEKTTEAAGGNVTISAPAGGIALGDNNSLDAHGGDIALISGPGNIQTGEGSSLAAFNVVTNGTSSGGNITIDSDSSGVSLGAGNTLDAVGGDLAISSSSDLSTGEGADLNAFGAVSLGSAVGGNITLKATGSGNVNVGASNTFNAVGGNVEVDAALGSITTGVDDTFNAFNAVVGGSSVGGNIAFTAFQDILLSSGNDFNAVGGNITLTALNGTVESQEGNSFCTFAGKPAEGDDVASGDIVINSTEDIILTGQNLAAAGNVLLTSDRGVRLSSDTIAAGDNIEIGSGSHYSIRLLADNTLFAGDSITLTAGGNIKLGETYELASGNNHLCADRGNVRLIACENIELGLGDRLESNHGSVILIAGQKCKSSGNIILGSEDTLSAGEGDLRLISFGGNINLGSHNILNAFRQGTSGAGDIELRAADGSISLGSYDILSAVSGSVDVLAGGPITSGRTDAVNAYSVVIGRSAVGGNISLVSDHSDISLGQDNLFNAVGGDLSLAAHGFITSGADDTFNAFNTFADGSSVGGNITFVARQNITLGAGNDLNAVGGSILLQSLFGTVISAPGNHLCTFKPGDEGLGDISIIVNTDLSLTGQNMVAAGDVSLLSAHGVILTSNSITASGGNVGITSGDTADIYLVENNVVFANGSISLASAHDIKFGYIGENEDLGNNHLCADTGNISLVACRNISLGLDDVLESNQGAVSLIAGRSGGPAGSIYLGRFDTLAAGGGDLTLTSHGGDIDLGSDNTLNAFFSLSNPLIGGSILLTAADGNINLGTSNDLNAVGGHIIINSDTIDIGQDNKLCTFQPRGGPSTISITLQGDLDLTGKTLTVQGSNLAFTARSIHFVDDIITVVGGDLSLTSTGTKDNQDVFIDTGNVLTAYSSAFLPGFDGNFAGVYGGNIFITSARHIELDGTSGGIGNESLPDEQPTNVLSAFGGNIVMNAFISVDMKFDNVLIATKYQLPNGTCAGPGGGIYIVTHMNTPSPLPAPDPSLNVFILEGSSSNNTHIDPTPNQFSSQTNAANDPISQHGGGGDPSMIDVSDGGMIDLNGGDSLVHVLSSDFKVSDGIIYMHSGGDSNNFHIMIKDSSLTAGCFLAPPPPLCPPPVRPDCRPPENPGCVLPESPVPPLPPDCQPPPIICLLPEPPAPPTPPLCPTPPLAPLAPECPGPPSPPPPTECFPPPPPPTPPGPPTQAVLAAVQGPAALQALAPGLPAVVAQNPCTAWFVQDMKESYLQATSGTELAVAQGKQLVMSNGSAIVKAGDESLTINPAKGEVTLKANAVALIESPENAPVRIVALDATEPDGVTVNVEGEKYTIAPGEELLISETNPLTVAQRPPLEGRVEKTAPLRLEGRLEKHNNVFILRAASNLPEEIPKMVFIQCRQCALRNQLEAKYSQRGPDLAQVGSPADKLGPAGNLLRQQPDGVSSAPPPGADLSASLSPVSLRTPVSSNLQSLEARGSTMQADADDHFLNVATVAPSLSPPGFTVGRRARLSQAGENVYTLDLGSVIVNVRNKLAINTPHAGIIANVGSIVLVSVGSKITRVRDLSDRNKDAISILIGKHVLTLFPGKEAAVVDTTRDPLPVVFADGLSRRGYRVVAVDRMRVVTNDFSILDALIKHPLLQDLRHSPAKGDIATVSEIMKTAAVINWMFDRYKGPYVEPVVAPNTGLAGRPAEPVY